MFCFILIVSAVALCIIYCVLRRLISTERIINFLSDFSTALEFLFLPRHSQLHPPPHLTALPQPFPFSGLGEINGRYSCYLHVSHLTLRDFQGPQEPASVPLSGNTVAPISAATRAFEVLQTVPSRASAPGPLG